MHFIHILFATPSPVSSYGGWPSWQTTSWSAGYTAVSELGIRSFQLPGPGDLAVPASTTSHPGLAMQHPLITPKCSRHVGAACNSANGRSLAL